MHLHSGLGLQGEEVQQVQPHQDPSGEQRCEVGHEGAEVCMEIDRFGE